MYKVFGKVNGKGHRVYIKTIYADDRYRLAQAGVMYTSANTYTNLTFVRVE